MQAYWTLVRRELGSHFFSWGGYVVMAGVLFLIGVVSVELIAQVNGLAIEQPLTSLFYSTWYLWLILMLATPVITMRSFAQEKFTGTYETLMTTAVSDWQVVMAKFSGALAFYALMCLPLLSWFFVVRPFTNDATVLDSGTVISTFLGIMLWGSLCISLGCLSSAITRSQIIAVIISLASVLTLFLVSYASAVDNSKIGWRAQLSAHLALTEHMQDFARGVVDSRPVVFYLSLTGFFLFLTLKVVESRRWK